MRLREGVAIDVTTDEKLEGSSRVMNADPIAFPPPSFPPCLHLLLQPRFAHSLPYSSFILPLNLAMSFGEAL